MSRSAPIALILAAAATLGGCHAQDQIAATEAWVRLPAVPGRPAAAYFTLRGTAQESTLIDVTTPAAAHTEMHESMTHAGMARMTPIDAVPLPAGSTVTFAPGGKHVMLFGLNPDIAPGAAVPLTLTFAGLPPITVEAKAVAAGAPAPFADK